MKPAGERTIILLGHEYGGAGRAAGPDRDEMVEVPVIGQGASLNVAVAGSLVLYLLAGLA
jgi:tRNA (guanosine-2'-O-)-methyltransferase